MLKDNYYKKKKSRTTRGLEEVDASVECVTVVDHANFGDGNIGGTKP
jgi:hypothetical protein